MWAHLEAKLVDWEKRFGELWLKKTQGYIDLDREYVARELPLLKAEKRATEMRLRKIEELIAKTHVLIDDLNEDLCRKLSGGRSLAAVGEALLEEFGPRLNEGYSEGRRKIREFLEKHYTISKAESRDLFPLLEEVRTLNYQVDIPGDLKDVPLAYNASEGDSYPEADRGVIFHLNINSCWEIKA